MKILHTADWHMNNTLGRVDIGPHIITGLEQIAGLLEEHDVDVMLVAGDLFSERSRPEQMRQAVSEIRRLFLPFLERGGTIIAISGNHDSEVFFETLRDALRLAAPGRGTDDAMGRLHLTASPECLRLRDRAGVEVQFVLMPYPTPRCYLRGEVAPYNSLEEKHQRVQDCFTQMMQTMRTEKIDERLPSVLVSHIHVRGAQTHTLYKVSETDDVIFEPGAIPSEWAYAAYGHIHKPGPVVQNSPHIRYSGSVAKLDAAERDDVKSVVLFEVGATGRIGAPRVLPLRTAPFYQVEINDPEAELTHLAERYPLAGRALVYYTLRWQPDKHNLAALLGELDKIFPFWYGRTLEKQNATVRSGTTTRTRPPIHDVAATVRGFLTESFKEHAERDDILTLAGELLAEEGWR